MRKIHIVNYSTSVEFLKDLFSENKIADENSVYCFDEFLSIGPLFEIETKNGMEKRREYSNKILELIGYPHIPNDKNEITGLFNFDFSKFNRVIVWHGKNPQEQLLKAICCQVIPQNILYEIDISKAPFIDGSARPRTSEECDNRTLKLLLSTDKQIGLQDYSIFKELWKKVSLSKKELRIYTGDEKIVSVPESYFDQLIIDSCNEEYMSAMRVIGTVLGSSKQSITYTFIAYRIIYLINQNRIISNHDIQNLNLTGLFVKLNCKKE